ncbi:pilus assembly protein [Neisseria sp. Ec49-e6-T10]|uniref:pilus assembly protein n=1 Tax=Neisseria sp. Ec49-e6-T10 TaxID=3140744 RepID=UPI003EB71E04
MEQQFFLKRLALLTSVIFLSSGHSFGKTDYETPFFPVPGYLASKSEGVKPNVMLFLDNSLSMNWRVEVDDGDLIYNCKYPDNCRMTIAKDAIADLVSSNPDLVRWGFTTFMPKDFVAVNDNNASNVISTLNAVITEGGGTPTMPIFYQLTRYFQGLKPTTSSNSTVQSKYGNWGASSYPNRYNAVSPIEYRCQKNFIIVVSDGDANAALHANERNGDSLFKDLGNTNLSLPEYAERAFSADFKTTGTDKEGGSWQDPNFPLQNIITYTIGFSKGAEGAAVNLKEAADVGGGVYYPATDSAKLVSSLQDALSSIAAMNRAGSPPAYTSDDTQTPGEPISVKYNSSNWSAEVFSYGLTADGEIDTTKKKSVSFSTGTDRNIWFKSKGAGQVVSLQTTNTNDVASTFGVANPEATNLIKWLQGTTVSGKRTPVMMGDVINSNISVTQTPNKLFSVGSNGGTIHVFKRDASGYKETFVYMPSLTLRQKDKATIGQVIPKLMEESYGKGNNEHRYLVDGGSFYRGMTGGSAGTDFHLVVGSTGRGGAGIYALDMAQIAQTGGNADSILYDFTNGANTSASGGNADLANLGYTVGTPVIAKVNDGGAEKWITIIASGYYSTKINQTNSGDATGTPTLYLLNMKTGQKWQNMNAKDGKGLSSPTVVDIDNDGFADYVYAGDLKGDLYRFDLSKAGSGSGVTRVFKGDSDKPITSAPAIFHKDGQLMVVFGTGSLLTEDDNTDKQQQSFYGIIDDLSIADLDIQDKEDDLVTQEFKEDSSGNRTLSSKSIGDKKGWKIDLSSGTGERVVYQPMVSGHTVYFTTQIVNPPASDKLCDVASGGGYLMSVDAQTGGHPKADNSHFAATAGSKDYFAGLKTSGTPSAVSSKLSVRLNQNGVNGYGQLIAGRMDKTRSLDKDPWYATGQQGSDKEGMYDGQSSIIVETENGPLVIQTELPKYKSTGGLSRRLSWRVVS